MWSFQTRCIETIPWAIMIISAIIDGVFEWDGAEFRSCKSPDISRWLKDLGSVEQPPSLTSYVIFCKMSHFCGPLSTSMYKKQIGIPGLGIRIFFQVANDRNLYSINKEIYRLSELKFFAGRGDFRHSWIHVLKWCYSKLWLFASHICFPSLGFHSQADVPACTHACVCVVHTAKWPPAAST